MIIKLKEYTVKAISKINFIVMLLLMKYNFTSSIYYLLFSREFDREHKAFLEGKKSFMKGFQEHLMSLPELRRNIHRLEKGLIMAPRKDVFAENYIIETVKLFLKVKPIDSFNKQEIKWANDVLEEYFSIVEDTSIIKKAKDLFNHNVQKDIIAEERFIPYSFSERKKSNISLSDLNTLLYSRRSVRWYLDKEVPIEKIDKAINSSSYAPSACNRQPYFFYVSKNKSKAVEIAKCAGGTNGWAENIPCTIAVVGDLSAYEFEKDRHVIYIDSSLATMQLLLALEVQGLSSCCINWADKSKAEKKIGTILNLKPYERVIMLISVGYGFNDGKIPYSQKKNFETLKREV